MTETDPLDAPVDPRDRWDLPAFGAMPGVADLDPVVTRVVAPNPSPMTLDGTNTYVVGVEATGEVIVVDPGPDEPGHLGRVRDVLAARRAVVRAIVVTHHHRDHAAAAQAWARAFGCRVHASSPAVAGETGRLVADGDRIPLAEIAVEVVATPGHTLDHVALRLETGAVLTGDHVLGRGTSVVAYPDGDLAAYLASLRRLMDLGPDVLLPGHGPELTEDPTAVLRFYRDHRRYREMQLLGALRQGPSTVDALVRRLYGDVDRRLWPAAEASTRAALVALGDEGRIHDLGDGRVALSDVM